MECGRDRARHGASRGWAVHAWSTRREQGRPHRHRQTASHRLSKRASDGPYCSPPGGVPVRATCAPADTPAERIPAERSPGAPSTRLRLGCERSRRSSRLRSLNRVGRHLAPSRVFQPPKPRDTWESRPRGRPQGASLCYVAWHRPSALMLARVSGAPPGDGFFARGGVPDQLDSWT
jgi:hypothetical protein